MSFWSDVAYDMPLPLDIDTADRLLAGSVAPEDAPPGYAELAGLVRSAIAEPVTTDEFAREAEVVAMVAAAVRSTSSPRRFSVPFALSRPRIGAALVAACLACSVGLAAAGTLPGAAQDIASTMLEKLGITVPGPNDNAGTHPNERGKSTTSPADLETGNDISGIATDPALSGIDKGAAVSTAASDGKSRAGTQGSSGGSPPVATPNGGGTGTADAASGGASSVGTATGGAASDGQSASGSGSAGTGQETADEASGGKSTTGQSQKP